MYLCFDMDGTLVNFYGYPNWLEHLDKESTEPYRKAEPLFDFSKLNNILLKLKTKGYKIMVISWNSKKGSVNFNKAVRQAKVNYLQKYSFPYDEIHVIKYGVNKETVAKKNGVDKGIIFDDDARVRDNWTIGDTVNPITENIIEYLERLM